MSSVIRKKIIPCSYNLERNYLSVRALGRKPNFSLPVMGMCSPCIAFYKNTNRTRFSAKFSFDLYCCYNLETIYSGDCISEKKFYRVKIHKKIIKIAK